MEQNIYTKLANVQKELKAPKNQYNKFGGYNYRSCEDILEAAKPLCIENGLILTLTDSVIQIGDRFYVRAKAVVTDMDEGLCTFESVSYAREPLEKKASDPSQITGAASSYARKYALNGLFCIDDAKDADGEEKLDTPPEEQEVKWAANMISEDQIKKIEEGVRDCGYEIKDVMQSYPNCAGDIHKLNAKQAEDVLSQIEGVKKKLERQKKKAEQKKGGE